MGAVVVDLPGVLAARAALEELAAAHPELCQGAGRWTDNLEELDAMTTGQTPGQTPERVKKYRRRLVDEGRRQVAVWLTAEAAARLDVLRAGTPGASAGDILSRALLDWRG